MIYVRLSSERSDCLNIGFLWTASQRMLARARNAVSIGAAWLLVLMVCAPAQAQILADAWQQESPSANPPARYIHALTYDAAHGQVVLFGGFGGGSDLNDTWLWNGTTWSQANPGNSPSPRAAHAMAYDAAHSQVILFGGLVGAGTRLGDTWLWDGTDWTQANPAVNPPARDGAAMVYDAAHSQVVLFGGTNGTDLNDTWLWNGTDWIQASPAISPSARADYSMVYDSARGQVVLFGGMDASGNYLNDTWVWDGSNWIQQTPLNSPPARYAQGMAYDGTRGQTVLFGGYNGSFFNDTWVWDGANWTEESTAVRPAGRYAPNAMTFDQARGRVVLFGGLGSTQTNDTWLWGSPGSFGNVNVCPTGSTAPAPCSKTVSFTYQIATSTSFGAIRVVTQGTSGLDFSLANGNTCTGTIASGTCTVNVAFTPLAPGLRLGAVQLFDSSGNLLSTTLLNGNGQGPAIAFGPGSQATVSTSSLALFSPKGAAVDAAGNLFIADNGNQRVVKVAPNGTQTTIGVGLNYPQGMAVDGAGNLFIADNNLNQVVEVPAGCNSSNCQRTVGNGLRSQLGVAVDGLGNVFIGDFLDHLVVKVPANGGSQEVVYNPGPSSNPVGLTVDSAGDLFIADFGLKLVIKLPSGCASSSCQIPVGSGWGLPEAVAVDAAGNVFVADETPKIVEVPAGCSTSACQITVSTTLAYGLALNEKGDIYIPDLLGNQMLVINRSQAPSLSFAATNVGSTSSDSPQSISIQNIGNQPLNAVNAGLVVNGPNFAQVAGSGVPIDCTNTFSLAPGDQCNVSISFGPQTVGDPLSSTAVFTDNALNEPSTTQTLALNGIGVQIQPSTIAVPNVVGQMQTTATSAITGATLALGTVSTEFSSTMPSGSVISQDPAPGAQVTAGTTVAIVVSMGQPPAPNQLSLENNYFVTGDYAAAGVTLRGTGQNGMATGAITIPSGTQSGVGVPDGADILDAYLYWETVESTPSPSGASGTFRGYPITGQQLGSDQPYTDGTFSGTLRVYRADVNVYLPAAANGIRYASGTHTVSFPDGGGNGLPLAEGASLVVIYRVLSPNVPLKSVVIYDGSALPTSATGAIPQTVRGFYDAAGGANGFGMVAALYTGGSGWNNNLSSALLGAPDQFNTALNPGNAYAAIILSTPVNNSDKDGILDAWKAGPVQGDFHAGQPGYYDVKTGNWVPLPGAARGQKDLFVQLDYMCGGVLSDGTCDPTKENLFPSPDALGRDPLAMVQQAFANHGVHLHVQIGNAVPEDTCTDNSAANPGQLCQFPNQPGVVSWKNGLEIAKLWPRNFASCATGGDCTTRFPYGQKDSYHYVLFGHSLAIPAWNSRFGTLASINVSSGVTTIVTADRGNGINACPSRVTISGVLGNPGLNGVYNTTGCADTKTITVATPGVRDWSYPNSNLPEPVIGLTSGNISSISGYSDLGGADSAVTLGLWATAPNQDMSKRANVQAGTMFHEIGHTLGLSHGGLYYDIPGNFVPTFEANCKPNYQSSMNYLFQLDGVGPTQAVDFSNQALVSLNETSASSTTQLIDPGTGLAAGYPTSAWYVPITSGTTASPATRHCDGTPLNGESFYRIDSAIAPITPAWSNGQDINFDGQVNPQMRGFNDWANIDLRQVGATGGQFASLATLLSFGSSSAPLNIVAGGNVTLGSGGTVTLGSGGNVTLGSGGNVTLGSGGTIALGSGGNITLGSGGNVTLGSGGIVTPGSNGTVTLSNGGAVTLSSGGTITLGSGGNITLGSGGTVTLGSGGTVTDSGVTTVIAAGGAYTFSSSGGTVTLGIGGNVTLGSGGNVTLGSGGTIALGSGGNVTLGSGGNVTLGSGGTIALGSGGNVTLGSGGNVTLGSGGTITLGSGGNVTLGSGGNVTLGSGGTVTLGSGGDLSAGGGNITLGSGGTVTLGSGGTVTLGSGGTVTLGSGGNVTLGSGGNITLGSGGTITMGSGGNITLGSGGNVTLGSGGTITDGGTTTVVGAGTYTIGAGGTIALGSGGNITLGSGGNVTLGSGGNITMGSGGTVTLGSGGTVTLGSGGVVALGSGGNIALGSGGNVTLGSGGNVTLGSGGVTTDELTYETANSVVRPPSLPTETRLGTTSVRIDWTAPAFGVVETYTIYRSSDGAPPIEIGSVSGVNGNPPATTFTDTNPDLGATTVVYTISTTLVPDPGSSTQRQSPPSAPAVLKNDQTIVLGPMPSSVIISGPQPTVTAIAETGGAPNVLQVTFTATGSCSIGSQSIDTASGVSSATVTLNNTGGCTITASQPGSNVYNSADPVSGAFTILPQGSTTQSQTISWAPLADVQYGGKFSLSATSSAGLPVTFTAAGPCTSSGTITGVGLCRITAASAANATYSAASVTQSFTIHPAVLKVTADNSTTVYGQPLPSLTYKLSGFVNGDPASAVGGAPLLSTTATPTSNAASYPITVSTGTLAAANYSFLYVSGVLTIQPASQAITFTTPPPASAAYKSTFTVSATGGASGNPILYTSAGACSNVGAVYTMTNSVGTCSVVANQGSSLNYAPAPAVIVNVTATGPAIAVSTSNIDFGTVYLGSITTKNIIVTNTGTAPATISEPFLSIVQGGNSKEFVAANLCLVPLSPGKSCIITIAFIAGPYYTPQTATLQIIDNAPGSPQPVALKALVINPRASVSPTSISFGTIKRGSAKTVNVILSNPGATPLSVSGISITGTNAGAFSQTNGCGTSLAAGDHCTIAIKFAPSTGGTFSASLRIVDNAINGSTQTVPLSGKAN